MERDWSCAVGRALPGGSNSYVARAIFADGSAAVLKVALTADGLAEQVATLQRADGRGYARLLRFDLDRRAMLLESLGPALSASRLSPEQQLVVLTETLREAWLPAVARPEDTEDKANGLRSLIERCRPQVGSAWPDAVFDQALAFADSLVAAEPGELVVVHGDPHPGNALALSQGAAAAEPGRSASGYCFVDPDGFVADRAYDLGVTLRDWCGRVRAPDGRDTLERYCDLVAEHSGVDRDRIWRWAYLERVTTGLYVLEFGAEAVGRPFLDTAARLLD